MASELAKAYVQIVPTSQGLGGKLESMLGGEADKAGVKTGNILGGAVAKGLGIAGAGIAAAMGTATAAVGKFASEAVSSYANYEQLVGGVEKLYGDAAGKLQDFANEAYKTSGMSANQYMETATSFSASLIKSLNGDVDKAAEMTDVAMRAISDNVNVFGSDMESVQNAFQGFAKENYTMLDNLKLGYGGTKEGMKQLIEDAAKASKAQEELGLSVDATSMSFDNIVKAIQVVQYEQGIYNATANEAMTTIEGSAKATKAAWENVITAIGSGEGLSEAMNGLITSIFGESEGEGLLNQIIPRIETTMSGIGDFIATAAPLISDKLPALIDSIVPTMLQSGMTLLKAVGDGILSVLPSLIPIAVEIAMTLLNGLISALPQILNMGMQIILELGLGIAQALPELIPAAVDAVLEFAMGLLDNIDLLIDAALKLIIGLAEGLIKALPKIIEKAPIIIGKLVDSLIQLGPQLVKVSIELIAKLATGLIANIGKLLQTGAQLLRELFNNLFNNTGQFSNVGSNIVQGLKNGISGAWNNMVSWFKGLFGDLVQIAKDILGIASPSKVFKQIGEFTTEGFDEGMKDFGTGAIQDVQNAMDEISGMSATVDAIGVSAKMSTDPSLATPGTSADTSSIEALLLRYLPMLENVTNVNVSLQGDAQGLFRTVRKEVNQFTKSTGNSPFIAPA